jgi:hypothetical protein
MVAGVSTCWLAGTMAWAGDWAGKRMAGEVRGTDVLVVWGDGEFELSLRDHQSLLI